MNSGSCVACSSIDSQCATCHQEAGPPVSAVCDTCNSGYTWSTTENKCIITCTGGLIRNAATNTCDACATAIPNCLSCDSVAQTCTSCVAGRWYDSVSHTCKLECDQQNTPVFLNSAETSCDSCPDSNCQRCFNSTGGCEICNSGFRVDSEPLPGCEVIPVAPPAPSSDTKEEYKYSSAEETVANTALTSTEVASKGA